MHEHHSKTVQKNKTEFKETQLTEHAQKQKNSPLSGFGPDDGDDGLASDAPVEYAPKEARQKSLTGAVSSIFHWKKSAKVSEGNETTTQAETTAQTETTTQAEATAQTETTTQAETTANTQSFSPVELEHAYTEDSDYIYEEEDDLNRYLNEDLKEGSPAMKTLSDNAKKYLISFKYESEMLIGKRKLIPVSKEKDVDEAVAFLMDYEKELKMVNEDVPGTTIIDRYKAFVARMNDKYGLKNEDHKFLEVYAKKYVSTQGSLSLDEIKKAKSKYIFDYSSDKEDQKFTENFLQTRKEPLVNEKTGIKYVKNARIMRPCKRPLFSHEPTAQDVAQGDIGDCYLISSINAIVEKDPKLIKDMMRDNGDSVTVRFYKPNGTPIYVTVKKSLSSEGFIQEDGKFAYYHTFGAADGGSAFWVCMLEKAYAAVRYEIEPDDEIAYMARRKFAQTGNKYEGLDSGNASYSNGALLGKKFKHSYSRKLVYDGKSFIGTYMRGDKLAKYSMDEEKKAYQKELKSQNKKFDSVGWNIKRAELFFGVKIADENDALYKHFSDDTIYKKLQDHILNVLSKSFTTTYIETTNDGLALVEYIKKYIDDMPELNIPGYDDKVLKEHYLKYLKDYVLKTKKLSQTINKTGKYTKKENNIFEKIKGAKAKGKLVMTNTIDLKFTVNEAVGKSGERVIHGVAGNHQYSIRDVVEEERVIAGKKVKQKFVIIVNPWKDKIRQYDKEGNPYAVVNDKNAKIATGGAYKMELRDYITTFDQLLI